MRSISRANLYPANIHPALRSFADECTGVLARLIAYVGALALIAIVGLSLCNELPLRGTDDPAATAAWSTATRGHPAFAVSQFDSAEKTEAYEILRHPDGSRKDVFRWAAPGQMPMAELEIYRPGVKLSRSVPLIADIAGRMDPDGTREPQAAGVIHSKFGAVTLIGLGSGDGDARSCLGFITGFDHPGMRISGWSCQGDTLPARRAAIGCMLDRLILLTAGNDPKLAELFAQAELRRVSCAPASASVTSANWVTSAQNPALRGSL
jgi:hypothetical protein